MVCDFNFLAGNPPATLCCDAVAALDHDPISPFRPCTQNTVRSLSVDGFPDGLFTDPGLNDWFDLLPTEIPWPKPPPKLEEPPPGNWANE